MNTLVIRSALDRAAVLLLLSLACLVVGGQAQAVELVDDRGIKVVLPQAASRIAAISAFGADAAIAFGVVPVAVSSDVYGGPPDYLGKAIQEVALVGPRHQPDLEQLSRLAPDLLISIRRYTELNAARLEKIAPMVALDLITLSDSLSATERTGEILGKPAVAARLNASFLDRVQKLRQSSPASAARSFALLTSSGETPFIYYDHFLPITLLNQFGLKNIGGKLADETKKLPLGYRISLESLLESDPDFIFVMQGDARQAYMLNPIWPYLKAVRNNAVVRVGSHWKEPAGPIAREMVVDDIMRFLSSAGS